MEGFKNFLESVGATNPVTQLRQPAYSTNAYRKSIQRGHASERDISQGLQTSCGWRLIATTDALQDMRHAIDTFMVDQSGKKIPVQIKARKWGTVGPGGEKANDVGYEVAKDFNANDGQARPSTENLLSRLNGRDMRGMAQLTVVLDQRGDRIYIIDTNEGHKIIQKTVAEWLDILKRFDPVPAVKARYERSYQGNGIELVTKFDTRDHYWKVMAYIKPQSFTTLQVCHLQNKIDTRFDY